MATIAKISNGASASSALNYALGKDKELHNNTNQWLEDNHLERPPELANCRAVAVGGTNGIDPIIAKDQFKAVQRVFNQDKRRNQVLRIVQSFALNELDPTDPSDWQRANDLGCELSKKLYPQYQTAVYTQVDGKNHILHNHIVVNKVNLETGKKLDERKGAAVENARKANDEIAKKNGWKVIPPVREHQSKTEQDLTKKGQYSYMSDLRSRIDSVMTDTSVSDFKTFSERLDQSGVNVSIRGKNISYAFLDANSKQRRARGKRLGTDYEKEAITNELESRIRKQATQGREQAITRDLQESSNELGKSEESKRIAQKDQQSAQADQQSAQADQSKINEIVANLERQAKQLRNRFGRLIKRFFKQDTVDSTVDSTSDNTVDSTVDSTSDNTVDKPDKQAQNQPTKPKRDKNGLSMRQRLIIDSGNKILRENGLGDLQMGYDGKTLREHEAEKNNKVAKPLEKKLTKGQIYTVYVANKKYISAGRPDYTVFNNGLSRKYGLKFQRFQKQQRQKTTENQVAQSHQQSKKQTPTRRISHKRLQIKKNQNQNKSIDRGPKM